MQTAMEAVLVDDLAKIAAADRQAVAAYRNKTLFDGRQPSNDQTDSDSMIVADDVQINQGSPTGSILAAAGIPAALLAAWMLWQLNQPQIPTSPQPQNPVVDRDTDTDTRYRITPLPGE